MVEATLQSYINAGMSISAIAGALGKSATAVRYWLKKFNLKTQNIATKLKYAAIPLSEQAAHRKTRDVAKVALRRKKVRDKAISYKGGACQICGYNKCHAALEFHHVNPDTKLFKLSSSDMGQAWSTIQAEVDKCLLLCANCHREEHFKINTLK